MTYDVLLLGAAGHSGRSVAAALAGHGLSVLLAGRHPDRLAQVATELDGTVDTRAVDVLNAGSLRAAMAAAAAVVNTVGPFARLGGPVVDACLAGGVPYIDIANELPAVRAVLARDEEARARGVPLVTGAGFGPGATETLVLRLVERLGRTPDRVWVATAPAVERQSAGVRETIAATLPEGATTYVAGALVRQPLGTGATTLTFGGARRPMLPGPVGDLEAARLASGAGNVVAFIADPTRDATGDGHSYAYAEVADAAGRQLAAELRVGEGVRASAAIAAETARRVLAGATPGAWTPGRLFGAGLVTDATGACVELLTVQRS